MKIFINSYARRKYKKYRKIDSQLSQKIDKALANLQSDPQHPSLRLHKLSGKQSAAWSVSVTDDLRILFTYIEEGILIIDIGKHEEVY